MEGHPCPLGEPMADYCPFCQKVVAKKDPDRVVINNSMTVCHGECLEKAATKKKPPSRFDDR